jgi:hypothetical protein
MNDFHHFVRPWQDLGTGRRVTLLVAVGVSAGAVSSASIVFLGLEGQLVLWPAMIFISLIVTAVLVRRARSAPERPGSEIGKTVAVSPAMNIGSIRRCPSERRTGQGDHFRLRMA